MTEGKEIVCARGAVAVGPPEAARAGAGMFAQGGNAMDAAAAACLVCTVLEPQMCDIGGYVASGVVLDAGGRVWAIDSSSRAPAAAQERMFRVGPRVPGKPGINESEYDCTVEGDANVYGPLSIGPPGFLAGVGTLWERWGKLKWSDIVAPAIETAGRAFSYGALVPAIELRAPQIRMFEESASQLLPGGRVPAPEDRWRRDDLVKTLQRISHAGWRDFYEGEIGRAIADYIRKMGGVLSRQDMADYLPRVTAPYETTYREARVYSAVLPNGGASTLEALNMLDELPPAPERSVERWHRMAEVLKLVWRDRLRYFGDPDYGGAEPGKFLSKTYAEGRVEHLRRFPRSVDRLVPDSPPRPSPGTIHLSSADAEGNVVAITISEGGWFGSGVTVPGTGVILGHGVCRLDPRPGRPNSIAPRKRPLNNICPTLVRLRDRDVALGTRGGRRIVSVSVQLVENVVDYGLAPLAAANSPRLHIETAEPLECLASAPAKELEAMGHGVHVVASVATDAHFAEFFRQDRKVRAGGTAWAAGL
ncbi:MAG: gamma-glutamyltransferase [Acidobacteria bacterium]|nr:gamma-glutamyltransferase [Acidobacteriota bacterium]